MKTFISDLLLLWQDFYKKYANETEKFLEFNYSRKTRQYVNQIVEALTFRNFIRNNVAHDFPERRSFLFAIISDQNFSESIRLIARIESLPSSVWRKILWRENIDFISFESFLRRITPEQVMAIQNNFEDLFGTNPKIPRVFLKSLRDRVRIFFGILSLDKILKEPYDYYERNQSKPAMAYNLLGLDFGFSLYPGGKNDDTKITNKKFTRFLSIKNHINDFIVNMEDGKYWWMYKSARSNFVVRYGKEVKIKTHICPGFWATMFYHLLFWIISPVLFTGLLITGIKTGNWNIAGPALFVSSLTPVWCVLAFLKLLFYLLIWLLREMLGWCEKQEDVFKKIVIFGLILPLGIVGLGMFLHISYLLVVGLSLFFGPVLAFLMVCALIFYFIVLIGILNESNFYRNVPLWVKNLAYIILGAAVLRTIDLWVYKHVARAVYVSAIFVADFASYLWDSFISQNLIILIWMCLSGFVFMFFMNLIGIFNRDEKLFVERTKRSTGFLGLWILLSLVFVEAQLLYTGNLGSFIHYPFLWILPLFSVITAWLAAIFQMKTITDEEIRKRMVSRVLVNNLNSSYLSDGKFKFNNNLFIDNDWLSALPKEQALKILEDIKEISMKFSRMSSYDKKHNVFLARKRVLYFVIKSATPTLIEQLKSCDAGYVESLSFVDRLSFIYKLTTGLTIKKAKKEMDSLIKNRIRSLNESVKKVESRKRMWWKLIYSLVFFLKLCCKPFIWFWIKIIRPFVRFLATIKDLWKLFNERCPYVTKSELLS